MLSAGALIWVSIRPLLRLAIGASCGFAITKADIFPPVAARGAGQIVLKIALPALMFSKIVPAFTPQNINALGPLIFVAVLYQLLGVVAALIIKQFFWVPHRFRYGIIVAGGWANVGDIPTAVIMSITGSAPFNGATDQTLSVAYVSAFILVFLISLFPLGAHRLIALDFVGPEVDNEELRMSMKAKTIDSARGWHRSATRLLEFASLKRRRTNTQPDLEASGKGRAVMTNNNNEEFQESKHRPDTMRHVSFHVDDVTIVPTEPYTSQAGTPSATEYGLSRVPSPEPTLSKIEAPSLQSRTPFESRSPTPVPPVPTQPSLRQRISKHLIATLKGLNTPPAIAILVALPIATVEPLKALFVPIPNSPIPNAPDGQPPLAFILDTATFMGAASIPIGLVCLGSALARLKVPLNEIKNLPIGAILWLAISKMAIIPVLGVLICEGLVNVGIIDREDKVLRFVCIFLSCIPTATTQVYLTQVYSGTGSAEPLAAFLIPQYVMMFVTMTATIAYSLHLLF